MGGLAVALPWGVVGGKIQSHGSWGSDSMGSLRENRPGRHHSFAVRCQTERCVGDIAGPIQSIKVEKRAEDEARPVLRERAGKRWIRSYWLDKSTGKLRVEEEELDGPAVSTKLNNSSHREESPALRLLNLPQPVVDFIMPARYPESVSSDYLQFMLWQFPTHVTGWTCSTLVTSSLLTAVGIGGDAGTAAATTAAVKWVVKDGLGNVGRFIIGGSFGSIFDDDPKQWRLYADVIGSAGGIFELATPVAPAYFIPLASVGRLTKAIARGLKDPSARVIQSHFAVSDNLGDVSAKSEVWEVLAQLMGLVAGVSFLSAPGVTDAYWKLVLGWAVIRTCHLYCRYRCVSSLQLRTINHKRALVLIHAFVHGLPIPGIKDCNLKESILVPRLLLGPHVSVGCTVSEVLGSRCTRLEVKNLQRLYEKEDYILVLHPNALHRQEARVILKNGATSMTVLRSMWQAGWLLYKSPQGMTPQAGLQWQSDSLRSSIQALHERFDLFLDAIRDAGWDTNKIVLQVPNSAPLLLEDPI